MNLAPDPVRIAILGFGTVGRAVARLALARPPEFPVAVGVAAVADRGGGVLLTDDDDAKRRLLDKESGIPLSGRRDLDGFLRSLPGWGVRTLVEALPTDIGSGQPALDLILEAIAAGLHVVTADKGPVVHGMDRIRRAARERGVRFAFTGATGVRPPEFPAGCEITEIQGVLNGTTNHILTRMLEGPTSFADALQEARERGIAEPDPSLDVDGWDTACKLLLLARQCMNVPASLSDVRKRGLSSSAEGLVEQARLAGSVVRLLGRVHRRQGRVRLSVAPRIVGPDSPFFSVSGTAKAAVFRSRRSGMFVSEAVSGRDAIARIVLEDVLSVSRG